MLFILSSSFSSSSTFFCLLSCKIKQEYVLCMHAAYYIVITIILNTFWVNGRNKVLDISANYRFTEIYVCITTWPRFNVYIWIEIRTDHISIDKEQDGRWGEIFFFSLLYFFPFNLYSALYMCSVHTYKLDENDKCEVAEILYSVSYPFSAYEWK